MTNNEILSLVQDKWNDIYKKISKDHWAQSLTDASELFSAYLAGLKDGIKDE